MFAMYDVTCAILSMHDYGKIIFWWSFLLYLQLRFSDFGFQENAVLQHDINLKHPRPSYDIIILQNVKDIDAEMDLVNIFQKW